jgi:hypothetical protein
MLVEENESIARNRKRCPSLVKLITFWPKFSYDNGDEENKNSIELDI